MAIELHRPTQVRLRRGRAARAAGPGPARLAIGTAARLILVGAAIGIFLMTGFGIASIAFIGVIALGAALIGWDR